MSDPIIQIRANDYLVWLDGKVVGTYLTRREANRAAEKIRDDRNASALDSERLK